jgi:hypothetical protein
MCIWLRGLAANFDTDVRMPTTLGTWQLTTIFSLGRSFGSGASKDSDAVEQVSSVLFQSLNQI